MPSFSMEMFRNIGIGLLLLLQLCMAIILTMQWKNGQQFLIIRVGSGG